MRVSAILCISMLLVGCAARFSREMLERRTLEGLHQVTLVMVLDARVGLDSLLNPFTRDSLLQVAAQGLEQSGLRVGRCVEGRLTKDGLEQISGKLDRRDIDTPALVFSTTRLAQSDSDSSPSYILVAVELFQSIRLDRNKKIKSYVATWGRRRIVPLTPDQTSSIPRKLDALLSDFIKDFWGVNADPDEIPSI